MPEPVTGVELSEEQLQKVEEFIEEEEGRFNRYGGWLAKLLTAVAVASSAFHLYAAKEIVRTGLQGWALRKTTWLERSMLVMGGLLVIAPSDTFDVVGVAIAVGAIVPQVIRGRIAAPA
jgi:TRAP-type uncharacterized transport system fused permease subunit